MKRSTQRSTNMPHTALQTVQRVSFSESFCLVCIVADSTQEQWRTLHYHLHTIPTGFLTFHLSYARRACHYRFFEGYTGGRGPI